MDRVFKRINTRLIIQALLLLGLLFLGHWSFSLTNSKQASVSAVVRLVLDYDHSNVCTGTIVGRDPVVVLTALHCLGNLETGSVLMMPEDPRLDDQVHRSLYRSQNTSSKVVFSDAVTSDDSFLSYSESQDYLLIAENRVEEAERLLVAAQRAGASDLELERLKKLNFKRSQTRQSFLDQKRENLRVLVGTAELSNLHDAVLLAFENSQRIDSSADMEDLIAENKLIPLDFSETFEKQLVMVAGFGMDRRSDFAEPQRKLHAGVNFLQRDSLEGVLVTYGLEDKSLSERLPFGTMPSILPGDSGGPLLSSLGVVGVNSRIIQKATMADLPVAPGWPLDARFNRYIFVFNEFIAVSSNSVESLVEKARMEGLLVQESNGEAVLDFARTLSLNQDLLDELVSPVAPEAP